MENGFGIFLGCVDWAAKENMKEKSHQCLCLVETSNKGDQISRSGEFHWVARTSRDHFPLPGHSHLASTLCDHSHLKCMSDVVPSTTPCKVTSRDHFHLASTSHDHSYLACMSDGSPPPPPEKSPHLTMSTSHDHFHLASTSCDHSHLTCMTDGIPSNTPWKVHDHSHLKWAFSPCIIHLAWK